MKSLAFKMILSLHRVVIFISGGSRISRRGGVHPLGGREPPTWPLFGENVCENERIGSHGGGGGACAAHAPLDPPMFIETPSDSHEMYNS